MMRLNPRTRIGSFLESTRPHPAKQINFKQIIWLKPFGSMYMRSKNK
jgi:hypothetical protein